MDIKLNLGCGPTKFEGWLHIDALPFEHLHHQGPVDDLSMFEDDAVSLIYASHILEHFGRHTYKDVLKEWYRVLKPGGALRLAVPNFEATAKAYLSGEFDQGLPLFVGLVVGGQRDRYDHHGMIFDERQLSADLKEIGFSHVEKWDWRTTEHAHIDDYSQAYLPHLDKENGTLMSLNLEATK